MIHTDFIWRYVFDVFEIHMHLFAKSEILKSHKKVTFVNLKKAINNPLRGILIFDSEDKDSFYSELWASNIQLPVSVEIIHYLASFKST
jgi:hypothetical protein